MCAIQNASAWTATCHSVDPTNNSIVSVDVQKHGSKHFATVYGTLLRCHSETSNDLVCVSVPSSEPTGTGVTLTFKIFATGEMKFEEIGWGSNRFYNQYSCVSVL